MKKHWKIFSIFEFSLSKLGYVVIFMRMEKKNFDSFFKTFLTNRGKNEDEDEKKNAKMSSIFEFSKLGYKELLIKI